MYLLGIRFLLHYTSFHGNHPGGLPWQTLPDEHGGSEPLGAAVPHQSDTARFTPMLEP